MSRFDLAVHNFITHITGSRKNYLSDIYEIAENDNLHYIRLNLIPGSVNRQAVCNKIVANLDKILNSTANISIDEVSVAYVIIDYHYDEDAVKRRMAAMKSVNMWYGHDPVFSASATVKLKNGLRCTKSITKS